MSELEKNSGMKTKILFVGDWVLVQKYYFFSSNSDKWKNVQAQEIFCWLPAPVRKPSGFSEGLLDPYLQQFGEERQCGVTFHAQRSITTLRRHKDLYH